MNHEKKLKVVAGPCMAESIDVLDSVASHLAMLAKKLDFDLCFKASFDKANRSAPDAHRGPGLAIACDWFTTIKERYKIPMTSDIHEPYQAKPAAEFLDVLQIPAFLCRQTDLIEAAVATEKTINIKKGQFMAPGAMKQICNKAKSLAEGRGIQANISVIERGNCFGHGDLVVDMRGLKIMADDGLDIIFDITHSTQQPPAQSNIKTSGANRNFAPLLARSAVDTGYLSGVFLEVHPEPDNAQSDAAAQLNLEQASALLSQIVPLWKQSQTWATCDHLFA